MTSPVTSSTPPKVEDLVKKALKEALDKRKVSAATELPVTMTEMLEVPEECGVETTVSAKVELKDSQRWLSEIIGSKLSVSEDFPVTSFADYDWDSRISSFIPAINEAYVIDKELASNVLRAWELNEKVLCFGPTGAGKSSLIEQLCARTKRPFIRVNCTGDMDSSMIFGQLTAKDGSTHWVDGAVTEAVKYGAVLLVDEWELMPPEVGMGFQNLLEDGGYLFLKEMPGTSVDKMVMPHKDFRIVYADELSGTYFGDKLPDMSTNSTGYIRGHNIGGAFIGGGTNPQQPLIKSMTKRVFGCSYTNIAIGGTPPTYILEFSQTPDALTDSDPEWNLIGPVVFDGFEADDLASFAVASSYVSVRIFDPAGTLARLSAATAAATTTPFIKTGTWTPVLTFVTPGDVAVSYSVQLGDYVQVGQPGNGFIELNCVLTTSAFTHTTASGNLRITGLPVAAVTSSGRLFFGAGRFGGITKAGYTDFSPVIVQGTSIVNIAASGSGVATALVAHGDTPTGGTVVVQFSMRYFI